MAVAGPGGEPRQRPLVAGTVPGRHHIVDGAAQSVVPVRPGDVHVGGKPGEGIPEPEGSQQPHPHIGAVKIRPGVFVGEVHHALPPGGIAAGPVRHMGAGEVFQIPAQSFAEERPVGDPVHWVLGAGGGVQHLQLGQGLLGGGRGEGDPFQPVRQHGVDGLLIRRLQDPGHHPEQLGVPVHLPADDRGVAVFHIPPHLGQLVKGIPLQGGGVLQHDARTIGKFGVPVPGQGARVGVAPQHHQHRGTDGQHRPAEDQPEIASDGLFHGGSSLSAGGGSPPGHSFLVSV